LEYSQVYSQRATTLYELEAWITAAVADIMEDML
jgi:hypothetical protein